MKITQPKRIMKCKWSLIGFNKRKSYWVVNMEDSSCDTGLFYGDLNFMNKDFRF